MRLRLVVGSLFLLLLAACLPTAVLYGATYLRNACSSNRETQQQQQQQRQQMQEPLHLHQAHTAAAQHTAAAAEPSQHLDNLRLQPWHWITYAAADAAAHGVQLLDAAAAADMAPYKTSITHLAAAEETTEGSAANAGGARKIQLLNACSAATGFGFLQQFQHHHGLLCGLDPNTTTTNTPTAAAAAAAAAAQHVPPTQRSSSSSVKCWAYPIEHRGVACEARNLVLNATAFLGPAVTHGHQGHLAFAPQPARGSVQLACKLPNQALHFGGTSSSSSSNSRDDVSGSSSSSSTVSSSSIWDLAPANMQGEVLAWFKPGVAVWDAAAAVAGSCSSREAAAGSAVVHHPVLFVSRLDPTNPFHHTQTLVQAFLTLAAINSSSLDSLQVILADHFPAGPFVGIWQRLSHPHPMGFLNQAPFANKQLCFRHSIHAHYALPGKAFLGYEGFGRPLLQCPSLLLLAAAHWLRYLLRDLLPAQEQQEYEALAQRAASSSRSGAADCSAANIAAEMTHDTHTLGRNGHASLQEGTEAVVDNTSKLEDYHLGVEASVNDMRAPQPQPSKRHLAQNPAGAAAAGAAASVLNPTGSGPPPNPAAATASGSPQNPAGSTVARLNPARAQEAQNPRGANSSSTHHPSWRPQQHRRLNVVWLSRSWFSKAHKAGGGLSHWQASRDLGPDQEAEVVQAIQAAVLEWNSRACVPAAFGWWQQQEPQQGQQQGHQRVGGEKKDCRPTNVSFDFRFVEPTLLPLDPDQVMLMSRTGVLVGVHGAALTNIIWMQPHRGAVVEWRAGGNRHYWGMAAQLGHRHFRVSKRGLQHVVEAVQQAMEFVSSRY